MIVEYMGHTPSLASDVVVFDGAVIVGQTSIGAGSNVWYNSVIRGDVNTISLGKNVCVQDLTMIHCTTERYSTNIADNVMIGHRALLHGCQIKSNVLIGMGAIVMDGATISENSIVGGGALITERKSFPPGVLILGSPAKAVRELSEDEIVTIGLQVEHYRLLAKSYLVK